MITLVLGAACTAERWFACVRSILAVTAIQRRAGVDEDRSNAAGPRHVQKRIKNWFM